MDPKERQAARAAVVGPEQLEAHATLTMAFKEAAVMSAKMGLEPELVASALINTLMGWMRLVLGYEREKIETELQRVCRELWQAESETQS